MSVRGARLYRSDALLANALHFGSDFAGTLAVLAGLVAAALGFAEGDSIAALFVSALVVAAAVRLATPERRRAHGSLARGRDAARASRDRDARLRRSSSGGCGCGEREASTSPTS